MRALIGQGANRRAIGREFRREPRERVEKASGRNTSKRIGDEDKKKRKHNRKLR